MRNVTNSEGRRERSAVRESSSVFCSLSAKRSFRGYTLIELIVSVAIFAIVMLAATGAYLAFINYNRRATQNAALMSSLSFAIDSMARDIRTGTNYACSATGPGACSSSGVDRFYFTDADGCEVDYRFTGSALLRTTDDTVNGCEARTNVPIIRSDVTPGITLNDVTFYVRGTVLNDRTQGFVTIVVSGTTLIVDTGEELPFSIETSATSRIPDL